MQHVLSSSFATWVTYKGRLLPLVVSVASNMGMRSTSILSQVEEETDVVEMTAEPATPEDDSNCPPAELLGIPCALLSLAGTV